MGAGDINFSFSLGNAQFLPAFRTSERFMRLVDQGPVFQLPEPRFDRAPLAHIRKVLLLALAYVFGKHPVNRENERDPAQPSNERNRNKHQRNAQNNGQNNQEYPELVAAITAHHELSQPIHTFAFFSC